MAETIESFVAKLQADGVEAGREEAQKLVAEAQQEAESIVAKAKADAETIIAEAKQEGDNLLSRSKTDLQLAARDGVMRLRETLSRALTGVFAEAVKAPLHDAEFLKQVLHELALEYAKADISGKGTVDLKLNPEMMNKLAEWAIKELHERKSKEGTTLELHETLRQAGFEYNVTGGTVEVTEESVIEMLKQMVGPRLREVFDTAAG